MLRSNSKQSRESMQSVLKKKRNVCDGKDSQKRGVLSVERKSVRVSLSHCIVWCGLLQ